MSDLKSKDYVISEQSLADAELDHYKAEIEFHGFFEVPVNGKPYRIYNPYILTITQAESLTVDHRGAGEPYKTYDGRLFHYSKPEVVDGSIFYEPYIEGYEKGIKDIKKRLHVTSAIFRTSEAQKTIEELHVHYYHSEGGKGWNAWKSKGIQVLSYTNLYAFGYYAGLMKKVDQFVIEFPLKFQGFHDCTTMDEEQPKEAGGSNGEDVPDETSEEASEKNSDSSPIVSGENEPSALIKDVSEIDHPKKNETTPPAETTAVKAIFVKDKGLLYNELVDSFNENEQDDLRALITEGKPISKKLIFNGSCMSLSEPFRIRLKDRRITTEGYLVAEWIAKHFRYTKKQESLDISFETMDTYLRRGSKKEKRPN
jgi:hypothetical protein